LIGHSLGGAASVLAAHRLKTVRSLVTLAAPSRTTHVRHLLADGIDDLEAGRSATITVAERSFRLNPGFIDDLDQHDVIERAAELDRPYCVIHARDDAVVDYSNGEALHQAAAEPKRLVTLDSGGHLFTDRAAADQMLTAVLNWFEETL
jgi:putative redox protein